MVSLKEINQRLRARNLGKKKPDILNIGKKHDVKNSGKKSKIEELLVKGDSLFSAKNYSQALQYYQKALELVPRKKKIWFNIAECYYAIGDYKNAIPCYNRFLRYKHALSSVNPKYHDEDEIIASEKIEKAYEESKIQIAKEKKENQERIEREIRDEEERRLAKQAEFNKNLKTRREELISSGNYIYIEKFVTRFGNKFNYYETNNLQELLEYKGFTIENGCLDEIIKEEIKLRTFKNFKEVITSNGPTTLEEYVENFFQVMGHNYEGYIPLLKKILHEDNIQFFPGQIHSIITEITRKEKIKRFERELMASEEFGSPFITIDDINGLDGYQFEKFLKNLFKKMGYKVKHTSLSGDQGADLILEKLGEKTVVQAKRYQGSVSNKAVQEVAAAIPHYKVNKGIVVTNSDFTKSAIELANSNGVELVDENKLKKWLEMYPIDKNTEFK